MIFGRVSSCLGRPFLRLKTVTNISEHDPTIFHTQPSPSSYYLGTKRHSSTGETDSTSTSRRLARTTSAQPVKFSTSEANIGYRATLNFYNDQSDLPASHNYVLTGSLMTALFYLIFLRDDIEDDGGINLFRPVHETIPELAIPMLQTAIAEHRKFGLDASKLEKKLAECLKEPEKYGGNRPRKLVEN